MQEIISPFRGMRLSKFQSGMAETQPSVESSPVKAPNRWAVNPVQVPREHIDAALKNKTQILVLHESDGSDIYSTTYENSSTNRSLCPSPIKTGPFAGAEVRVISPTKLKSFIQEQQAEVLFQIECTKQQIIENSPTKNTYIDDDEFLEFLNFKREEHRKKGHRKEASNVIEKLMQQIRFNK